MNPQVLTMDHLCMSAFEAKIKKITPKHSGLLTQKIPACYLGVSLGSINFEPPRLKAILDWAEAHSERCLIVVGDSLSRHTIMSIRSCPEKFALAEAIRIGDQFETQLKDLLTHYQQDIFDIRRWQDIVQRPIFNSLSTEFATTLRNNPELRASINQSAEAFLRRLLRNGQTLAVSLLEAAALSRRYIEEEIVAFAVLVSEGWNVEIYPGPELPVLRMMATGSQIHAPEVLRQRTNIELTLKQKPI